TAACMRHPRRLGMCAAPQAGRTPALPGGSRAHDAHLRAVRSHHKTTSAPPGCQSDERARGCRQSQRSIFILGLILQGSIHPLGNSTLVSGGGTFGRAGYYARWHVWAIAIVARLANNNDARSVIATKGVIKREPTLWRSAGPRR